MLPLAILLVMVLPASAPVDYNSRIQPIFTGNCTACHGGTSGVTLSSYQTVMNSVGDQYSRLVIVPENPSDSPLYDKISSNNPQFGSRMPQGGPPLSSDDIEAGLQMSPNLTTVGSMMNAYESGYNIGISLGYRIMSRLIISTGMIYSHISYSAAENDYNLPDGYLQGGALREMKGECQILELPVSLQFRMVDFNQSCIYATAGISSYIMLGEKYKFHLEGYNESPGSVLYRNVRSGTRHWLSNAGLSIGYERDVDQNWSLRVEPYVRIPINDVGWTRVRLYSVGTFFSINYRM